jgi:ATP-dependent Lon protease
MKIIPVSDIQEVLKLALAGPLVPIEWSEADEAALQQMLSGGPAKPSDDTDTIRAH